MSKKLFDYVIGNPPYNENFENSGDNGNFAKPVYNKFMDAVDDIGKNVELILGKKVSPSAVLISIPM